MKKVKTTNFTVRKYKKNIYICSFYKNDKEYKWFNKYFLGVFGTAPTFQYMLVKDGYNFEIDNFGDIAKCLENISGDERKNLIYKYIKEFKKARQSRGSKYGEWFLSELIVNNIIENKNVLDKVSLVNAKIYAIKNKIKLNNNCCQPVLIDGVFYESMTEFGKVTGTNALKRKYSKTFDKKEIFNCNYKGRGNKKKVFYNGKWYDSIGELLDEYKIKKEAFDSLRYKMKKRYGTSISVVEVLDEALKIRQKRENIYVVNGIDYNTFDNLCKCFNFNGKGLLSQRDRLQNKYNRPFTWEETVNYILKIRADKRFVVNGVEYDTIKKCANDFGISSSRFKACKYRLQKRHNREFSVEEVINYILNFDAKKLQKNS